MKNPEVIEALNGLVDDIAEAIGERHDEEISNWLMAATLHIWAGNQLLADSYVDALSVFHNKSYSVAQVITALDCAGEDGRQMEVPDFFQKIVARDVANKTDKSRSIADSIGRFLAMMALVNGDFTIEEAHALRSVSDGLLKYCDYKSVIPGKEPERHPHMITALSQTGYHVQPISDEPKKEVPQKDTKPVVNPSEKPNSDEPTTYITPNQLFGDEPLTIKLNLDLNTDLPAEEKPGKPEGNISVKEPSAVAEEGETLESVLAELNGLVGLDKVKSDVQSLLNFIKICQLRTQRGMKVPTISYHLVFTGNPGTGKTTVARMVAKLYYMMGILPKGQLVETDRSGLVAGYLGQTAIKTQKVIQEALGGVLFIDEAYALANDKEDSYGKEAIETILKAMEDHRDELVVIVAGYDELMHQFIDSNPGLRSRFNKYFHFPDYNGEELLLILKRFCDTNGYKLSDEAVPYLQEKLNLMFETREEHFGNARAIRNLFEHAINQQANRLVLDSELTDQELMELTLEDILPAMEAM